MEQFKQLHRNIPQLMVELIQANTTYVIWGRSTGKSQGPGASFSIRNVHVMPRSNGFLLGTTYDQILTRTLPSIKAGWEKLGFYEDKHYWVGKYAPDKLLRPRAFIHPKDPKHYIHWYNGTGIYLVSQDRPGTINGVRTQWGFGDEAKLLNKERLDQDLFLTMTGHFDLWGDKPEYLSKMWMTDMPNTAKGKWLLDAKNQVNHGEIEKIIWTQIEIIDLEQKFLQTKTESTQNKIRRRLNELYIKLRQLREESVYYSTATTFDNIHALGFAPLKQFKRQLSQLDWELSVLNKEIMKIEQGFYGQLDEDQHGYTDTDYAYVDQLGFDSERLNERDCRWDKDTDKSKPLSIACDYNNAINHVATGQRFDNIRTFKLLSTMNVLHPMLLRDCAAKWNNYYQHHPTKVVNYWYDNTAIGGNAATDLSFAKMWEDELIKYGWTVNMNYIGQSPSHASRHQLFGLMLQGLDKRLPKFAYNATNNRDWIIAAQQAGVLQSDRGIKKDKRSERPKSGVPPQHATHVTEAVDILVYGELKALVDTMSEFIPMTE